MEEYLADFLALFFPQAHAEIDWTRPPVFRDGELREVVRDAELGRRLADKLAQVWLRDGTDAWVLVHVEVQGQKERAFAKRMFTYYYRILDRYDREVVSLAVLADERSGWRPDHYEQHRWGCSLDFQYPIVKLRDWRERTSDLEALDNPFSIVVLAHLAAQATKGDVPGRESAKLGLVRRLYERGYPRERILSLFRFIDWLLALPEEREQALRRTLRTMEEEGQMPYITSIERLSRAEGREEGREEGMREAVRRLIDLRFGKIPEALQGRISAADQSTLDDLFARAATVQNVAEI